MRIDLPLDKDAAATLRAGDDVLLNGPVYTARDATHVRFIEYLELHGELPFDLEGQLLFYAGPTPARAGRPVGSVGPTTARRMDEATSELYRVGIAATLGKGARGDVVKQACRTHKTVYFGAIGGAAALLARHIVRAETIAYPELGTEALMRLELKDFPAFVAIDSQGNDFYETAPAAWRARMQSPSAAAASNVDEQDVVASSVSDPIPVKANPRRGRLVTFEGGEGAGKSSQIYALKRHFERCGIECEVVREPGGSKVSEAIRDILLDPANTDLTDKTELFLYEAARAQVVEEIIEPALRRGVSVLCDRYFDSTTAYQGFGRGLDLEMIDRLNSAACGEAVPDRTLVLDIDVETGLERAIRASGALDRLENENREFHERVRAGFLAIAAADPLRVRVIKADSGVVNVFAEVVGHLEDIFPELDYTKGEPSSSGDVR